MTIYSIIESYRNQLDILKTEIEKKKAGLKFRDALGNFGKRKLSDYLITEYPVFSKDEIKKGLAAFPIQPNNPFKEHWIRFTNIFEYLKRELSDYVILDYNGKRERKLLRTYITPSSSTRNLETMIKTVLTGLVKISAMVDRIIERSVYEEREKERKRKIRAVEREEKKTKEKKKEKGIKVFYASLKEKYGRKLNIIWLAFLFPAGALLEYFVSETIWVRITTGIIAGICLITLVFLILYEYFTGWKND